jgi:hypothetical protein
MKSLQTLALALVALGVLLPSPGAAQEGRRGVPHPVSPIRFCPRPSQPQAINLTASAPATATPNLPDFPASSCSAGWEANFGGTTPDRCFRHTFTWPAPKPECRCLSGELIIQYKALLGGSAYTSNSANDTVGIYSGGSIVAGTSQHLYSGAVTTGQTGTKTIPLNCDMLKNNSLSFLVQDDTSVTSATLHVFYCCAPCPREEVELTFPGTSLKYCCDGKPGATRFCCSAQGAVTISHLPMQGGNEKTPCPRLGVVFNRSDAVSVPYLGIMLGSLDLQCAAQGPGLHVATVKFLECAPDPRGAGFGPNAIADITCSP